MKRKRKETSQVPQMPSSKPDLNPKRLLHPVGEWCGTVRSKIRADTRKSEKSEKPMKTSTKLFPTFPLKKAYSLRNDWIKQNRMLTTVPDAIIMVLPPPKLNYQSSHFSTAQASLLSYDPSPPLFFNTTFPIEGRVVEEGAVDGRVATL